MLNQIESLLQTAPDSALILLDLINLVPNELYEQNRYFLYRIMAKDKSGQGIYMDKEIKDVYNYFENNNFKRLAYISALYCGKVLQENKEYDQAVTYYNIAESSAKEFKDKAYQGEALYALGRLMIDQYDMDEVRSFLTQANLLFKETDNHKFEIKSLKLLGFCFIMNDEVDSCLIYHNKALNLSIPYNDREEQALTLLNIGAILYEKGDYKYAINTLKQAIQKDSIVCKSGKIFMNLAESYSALGLIDSARYYAEYSLESINNDFHTDFNAKSSAYKIFSSIEEEREGMFSPLLTALYISFLNP